jgi:hypothetical protein
MKPKAPPASGKVRLNSAKTHARQSAPASVMNHPRTPFHPYGASVAGSRKIPADDVPDDERHTQKPIRPARCR